MSVRIYVCVYVYLYTYIYIHIHVFIYIHIYVCMNVYIKIVPEESAAALSITFLPASNATVCRSSYLTRKFHVSLKNLIWNPLFSILHF
jgi:hypothetical protein